MKPTEIKGTLIDTEIKALKTFNEADVYGKNLDIIKISDLLRNETAIKQLLNNYKQKLHEVERDKEKISELKSELEYRKTSPFYAIISVIINIVGTAILGIGVNLISDSSNTKSPNHIPVCLFICASLLIVASGVLTIFHPYVRGWFNKKSNNKKEK